MKARYFFIFSLLFLFSCDKPNNPPPHYENPDRIPDPVNSLLATYVPNMQGERTWSHYLHSVRDGVEDTVIVYKDSVFSIQVLNNSTISFLGRTLTFSRTLFWNGSGPRIDLDSTIYFTKAPDFHRFEAAYYYYRTDQIHISLKDGAKGGRWTHHFRSKD